MASLIIRVSTCWKGQCDSVGKGFPVRRGKVNVWGVVEGGCLGAGRFLSIYSVHCYLPAFAQFTAHVQYNIVATISAARWCSPYEACQIEEENFLSHNTELFVT